jgi:protein-tyrosine phosphatase
VIDLHCHVLPGLDDGPADVEASVMVARLAAADGTRTMVATPHIREDYPFDLALVAERTDALNARLEQDGVELRVVPGGEVALSRLSQLTQDELRGLTLASSRALLVESPNQAATDTVEDTLFKLQLGGFHPVLAHPERSPSFMKDPDRLEALVERGILCSVTAASMAGRFGRTVQRFARLLFERGMVHDVASDSHDIGNRSPGLTAGFRLLDQHLPGVLGQIEWFTRDAPTAILEDRPLPARPEMVAPRRGFFGTLRRRD